MRGAGRMRSVRRRRHEVGLRGAEGGKGRPGPSRSLPVLTVPSFFSPLTKVKLINELNAREAELGVQETVSWHAEYKDSAWIFIGTGRAGERGGGAEPGGAGALFPPLPLPAGGLHYELTEGDVICVFSQ